MIVLTRTFEPNHGTESEYKRGCRCTRCMEAHKRRKAMKRVYKKHEPTRILCPGCSKRFIGPGNPNGLCVTCMSER